MAKISQIKMNRYLTLYNLVQIHFWIYLLIQLIIIGPYKSYESLGDTLRWMIYIMLIEIVHSIFKISNSQVLPTLIQSTFRAFVLKFGMDVMPELFWNYMVMILWSMAEVIRFGYFNWTEFLGPNKFWLWLRYTSFIPLYPMGFFSEIMVYYYTYDKFSACCPRINSISMPNQFNFSFDFLYFFWLFIVPVYIVGMPFLISHMIKLRKKKLKDL